MEIRESEMAELVRMVASGEAREARMQEELTRPRVEIWSDPFYDDWAEWVRSHERKKAGNPVDVCEVLYGLKSSPLCPVGVH
jgi:hypothetical protein